MSQVTVCDAVVFNVESGVHVATVVDEFSELTRSSCITRTPLIILNGSGASPDFKNEVVCKLTAAFPSTKAAERVIGTHATMPVQGAFACKQLLDRNRISTFVVFTNEENLSSLVLVLSIIFTSVYHVRVRVYGDSRDVETPAILASIGESVQAAIKQKCSEYLASIPQDKVEVVRSALICDKTFLHGFSTRKGGCSSYPSAMSLNLAYTPEKRDPLMAVEENRRRLLKAVGGSSHGFELAKAVHGNCVWSLGSPEPPQGYDAIVCDKQGVVIAAPAADCVTIIFADANRSVCAVAHSGWKGILTNVTRATLNTMTKCFGCNIHDIRAVIGPSIGVCCYEVGMDVEKLFSDNSLLRQCIKVVEGKCKRHLDLQNAVRLQLVDAGVSSEHVDDSPSKLCTYCNEDLFFSYRRDGKPFGTHVGFIGLR